MTLTSEHGAQPSLCTINAPRQCWELAAGEVHDVALNKKTEKERNDTNLFIRCAAGFKYDDIHPFPFGNCTRSQCKPLTNHTQHNKMGHALCS